MNNFECPECGHDWVGNGVVDYCPKCDVMVEAQCVASNFDLAPIEEADSEHDWPGDGSGTDDLADYNADEADDYRDE